MSGLGVVGRDKYGVFPLRGKLLNVRDASTKQITDNAEISLIKQIMGLQHGKVYEDTKALRYGHLMIMTDQVGSIPSQNAIFRALVTFSSGKLGLAHDSLDLMS